MNGAMYFLLVAALLAANLPFLTRRFLLIFQVAHKRFSLHLIEWAIYFLLIGILAYGLETSYSSAHTQGAAFYAVVLCLFAIFAFPAFVWRYFWQYKNK